MSISLRILCVLTCPGNSTKLVSRKELNDLKDSAGVCIEMKPQYFHVEGRVWKCGISRRLQDP